MESISSRRIWSSYPVVGYGVMYVVHVAYKIGGQGVYFTSYIGLGSVA